MAPRSLNCSVGLPLHLAKYVFSDKIWYCPSDMFDEIRDVRHQVRIIFFAAERRVDEEHSEGQVLGYYHYPEYEGKAVFDSISRSFVHSQTGTHDVISGEAGDVVRFARYVKMPYLESREGHHIWRFDDADATKLLRTAQDTHLRAEDSRRVRGIVSSIQTVLSDIEESKTFVSSDVSQEYEALSPWLRRLLDSCEVDDLPPSRGVIRRLIGLAQEKRNAEYYLQAAKLQTQDGDYKFVITLANYCRDAGYQALDEGCWDDAFERFLEAARLLQRDPMITETGWKRDQRLRNLRLAVKAATSGVLHSSEYSLSAEACIAAVERKAMERLKTQLPSHQVKELMRDSYHVEMAEHLLDAGQDDDFLQFYEDTPGEVEFPQWMTLRYYREQSKNAVRQDHAHPEDFIQAAEYRKMAADLLADSEGRESVSYREEMVDYYKLRALSHLRSREVVDFESRMSDAIDLANELAEDPEATDLHAENLHFLQGVKYGGLARYETDPSLSAEQYFRASDAYGEVDSVVARGRSVFHQLMGYQSLMRSKLGKGPQDFEETALVCREALSKLWDSGEIEVLRTTEVLTYRTLFESLCLFTTEDLCPERWYRASRFHERVQAEPLEESARWIWNLAYGTRLVEGGGVTLGEITTKLRAAVRSAICQLLEGSAVSQREIYDDLVAVQVSDDTLERKKYIMSLLRRRRLGEEGLELECKQFFYDPNYESPHVVSSLREEVVAFLNSRTGGQIVIGVQDETFAPRGIEKDLQRFEGSEARLKDAVLNHITSTVQEGLPLPNITVSVEAIAGDKQVIYIDVPPGDYDRSLYKTNKGVAYIRMDGSKRTIKNAVEQDELAAQRRQGKGPWAPAR